MVGTRRSLLWRININLSEEQSGKYLFTVEGLDTATPAAVLIMSFAICMQSRDQAPLSEAALKQLCP